MIKITLAKREGGFISALYAKILHKFFYFEGLRLRIRQKTPFHEKSLFSNSMSGNRFWTLSPSPIDFSAPKTGVYMVFSRF